MAREVFNPTEREYTPEYWDGHSPVDKCRPKKDRETPIVPLRYVGLKLQATNTLLDFLRSSSGIPLNTLRSGEVFNPNDYPTGTVIRHTSEIMSSRSHGGNRDNAYYKREEWGVVAGFRVVGKELHKLITYLVPPTEQDRGNIFAIATMIEGNLEPGVVVHSRETYLPIIDHFRGITKNDKLFRFEKIEVHRGGILEGSTSPRATTEPTRRLQLGT